MIPSMDPIIEEPEPEPTTGNGIIRKALSVSKEDDVPLLSEFRKNIADLKLPKEELQDKVLVRWLRARNGNLKDAEQMIRKHCQWREEMDIANILENGVPPDSNWNEEIPWILSGFGEDGSPLCISDSAKWDFQKYASQGQGRKSEFIRYGILTLEEKWQICLLQGEGRDYVPQLVSIFDLKGLNWRQISCPQAMDASLTLTRAAEAHYPELVNRLIMVNVPWIFQIFWKLTSPLVSERTKGKLLFLGSDKDQWAKEISKLVPPNQFPKAYGGLGEDTLNLRLQYREKIKAKLSQQRLKENHQNED